MAARISLVFMIFLRMSLMASSCLRNIELARSYSFCWTMASTDNSILFMTVRCRFFSKGYRIRAYITDINKKVNASAIYIWNRRVFFFTIVLLSISVFSIGNSDGFYEDRFVFIEFHNYGIFIERVSVFIERN